MKKNILLAIFSGLMLWLAWPPMHYTTFFLFFGLVPMLMAVENIIKSNYTRKGAKIFETVFLGFFVWNTLSIYWVYNSLKLVGEVVAVPISLIPYALGPLLMASAFWLYYRFRLITNRSKGLIALVCFWIAYEYLHQTWDLAFPWMTLGNGFAVAHQWVQWYEYTGVYGGTIWIWAVNILVFLLYIGLSEAQAKPTRLKLVTALVLMLVLPLSFSLYTYNTYKEQPDPSNVVVVQPNIDPYGKSGFIPAYEQFQILTHLSDSVGQVNTEFFIWPETALPKVIDEDRIRTDQFFWQAQQFLKRYPNGNLLTGAETSKIFNDRKTNTASPVPGSGQFYDRYNAAVNIENSAQVQFYHKSKLVPGAEELPFGKALSFLTPVFEHLGGAVGSYAGQEEPGVLYSQSGIGAAPVICYESIWGEWVGGAVKKGAQFIAIITNDGWWENTSGKDQHLDYAKLRAIETRRWVARSANTGISAFINQRGDIVQQSKWWVRAALKQNINLNSDITFYVEHGDYLPKTGSFLAILGILFVAVKMRFKRKPVSTLEH
ncbi:apolipoprotein N-acyltransferase [Mucilaginibacter auburnensis]|uniref:Apolipoprotein N-acyltransferase n=1 Tax=Mucilaginibacter auburnensis TaxID=1457233 RepID=A0A2H9VNK8_9SPHI|nr:apolipoprotein N-acyltransferase [Mucilaginibacter auburnensis]PJJ79925.1 apolipoprotein N-acyltransferase [Mucilaginibacter auburnensis]